MIGAVWTTVDDIDTPELSPNFSTSCFLGIRLPRSMPVGRYKTSSVFFYSIENLVKACFCCFVSRILIAHYQTLIVMS